MTNKLALVRGLRPSEWFAFGFVVLCLVAGIAMQRDMEKEADGPQRPDQRPAAAYNFAGPEPEPAEPQKILALKYALETELTRRERADAPDPPVGDAPVWFCNEEP